MHDIASSLLSKPSTTKQAKTFPPTHGLQRANPALLFLICIYSGVSISSEVGHGIWRRKTRLFTMSPTPQPITQSFIKPEHNVLCPNTVAIFVAQACDIRWQPCVLEEYGMVFTVVGAPASTSCPGESVRGVLRQSIQMPLKPLPALGDMRQAFPRLFRGGTFGRMRSQLQALPSKPKFFAYNERCPQFHFCCITEVLS